MRKILYLFLLLTLPIEVVAQANYPASEKDLANQFMGKDIHIREEFLGEACSEFSVLSRDPSGVVQKQSLKDAAIIRDEIYAKEQSPELVTVHAVVNEKPERSLQSVLRQLASINKLAYARVGSVYVVTEKNPFEFLNVYTAEKLQETLLQLSQNNTSFSMRPVRKVPSQYSITHSPTWVIEYNGEEHVFEGNYSLTSLLDGQGRFLRDKHE